MGGAPFDQRVERRRRFGLGLAACDQPLDAGQVMRCAPAPFERLLVGRDRNAVELDRAIDRRAAEWNHSLLPGGAEHEHVRSDRVAEKVLGETLCVEHESVVAERQAGLGEAMTTAVARAYHKLIAVKDEWEVARLFASHDFQRALSAEFEGPYKLHFHIGAWPFARPDPETGVVGKGEAGPWAMTAFRLLARLKFLRGTWLDPFRASDERKLEQRLVAEYEADIEELIARLAPANHAIAVRIASLPETIRGYGRVKEAAAAEAGKERANALQQLKTAKTQMELAA